MAKVTTYYVESALIQELTEEFGSRFEKISKQDKLLMIAAIALNAALDEGFAVVMEALDPDHVCSETVSEAIEAILEEQSTQTGLLIALSEQIHAKNYAVGE